MKKLHFFSALCALAWSLFLSVSCSENADSVPFPDPENAVVTFRATFGDRTPVKTVMEEDGTLKWDLSEDINLFYGASFSTKFSSAGSENSTTAEFKGTLGDIEYNDTDRFIAVYPYSEDNSTDGTNVALTLPEAQTAVAGTFADALCVLLAQIRAGDYDLFFYHLGGGIRFTVAESDIQSVTFKGNNGETLAGKVTAGFNEDGYPVVTTVTDAKTELTLSAPEGQMLEPGEWYYLVALPAELDAGYTMTLRKADGTETVRTGSGSVAIKRAVWGQLENADIPVVPDDEIWYTSSDGEQVTPWDASGFGAAVVSNTYSASDGEEKGKWIIKFNGPVTSIGKEAFYGRPGLTSITLPESVTSIEYLAFHHCQNLEAFYGKFASEDHRCLIVDGELKAFAPSGVTSYEIPASVTRIGDHAFEDCEKLVDLTLPESVEGVGYQSFIGCRSLEAFYGKFASEDHRCLIVNGWLKTFARAGITSYEIPASVKNIEYYAFSGCSNLTSVTIPDSVVYIGSFAFSHCGMTSMTFPNSITSIDDFAFYSSALTSVTLPESLTVISGAMFYWCLRLENVTIPESVTSIDSEAFAFCEHLQSIVLPKSITEIGNEVFSQCISLAGIDLYSVTPPELKGNAFDGCSGSINVPGESLHAYKTATGWSKYADRIYPMSTTWSSSSLEKATFETWR